MNKHFYPYHCSDCVHFDGSVDYHNVFDDKVWHGCNYGFVCQHTEDMYFPNGELAHCETAGCKYFCYEEKLQYSMFDKK